MTIQLETQMLSDGVHYLMDSRDIGKAVYQIDGAGRNYLFIASVEASAVMPCAWDAMMVRTLKAADYLALAYAEELHHFGAWEV